MATKVTLRLHPDLKEAIGQMADEKRVAMNDLMHEALARFVERPDLVRAPKEPVGRKRKPVSAA